MSEIERQRRAAARRSSTLLKRTTLASDESDIVPIRGAEAISLVTRLTRESWSLSGLDEPKYTREQTPYRFVPGRER